jgi:hypothetical protein
MIGNSQRNIEPLLTPPSPSATSPDSLVAMITSLTPTVQWCYSYLMQALNGESENPTYVLYNILHFGLHSHLILKRISFVYTFGCSVHYSKIS